MLGWVKRRGNQGRGEVARHQTLSRLGERCCWEISRWEETNWKFVGAGMYILGSVLSHLVAIFLGGGADGPAPGKREAILGKL